MSNPFLARMARASTVAHGRLSEARVASLAGARLQPNSGAMVGAKGDATRQGWRLEMKSTIHQTLSLELAWLRKITHEALSGNQVPAVAISFVTPEGKKQDLNADWVLIPLWKFKELADTEKENV